MGESPQSNQLETERLILRPWGDRDLEDFVRLYGDAEVMRCVTRRPVPRELVTYLLHTPFVRRWEEKGFGSYAVIEKETGAWLGHAGLAPVEALEPAELSHGLNALEIGFELHKVAWGRGLATEAVRAIIGFGFEILKLDRIIGAAMPENQPSHHVMEKCGLTYRGEGRRGDENLAIYAIDRPR